MAGVNLVAPEPFCFNSPDMWPHWIRRFERFRQASELRTQSSESQVNYLIYSMGDQADDILSSFDLTEAQNNDYDTVRAKFNSRFVKKTEHSFMKAKFNRRCQENGESVDSFITALYCLVEHCKYGALRDEMIRDRIVAGVLDSSLSEKMQLDSELSQLTLEKAVTLARQREVIKQQQEVVRGVENIKSEVAAIRVSENRRPSTLRQQSEAESGFNPIPVYGVEDRQHTVNISAQLEMPHAIGAQRRGTTSLYVKQQ